MVDERGNGDFAVVVGARSWRDMWNIVSTDVIYRSSGSRFLSSLGIIVVPPSCFLPRLLLKRVFHDGFEVRTDRLRSRGAIQPLVLLLETILPD